MSASQIKWGSDFTNRVPQKNRTFEIAMDSQKMDYLYHVCRDFENNEIMFLSRIVNRQSGKMRYYITTKKWSRDNDEYCDICDQYLFSGVYCCGEYYPPKYHYVSVFVGHDFELALASFYEAIAQEEKYVLK